MMRAHNFFLIPHHSHVPSQQRYKIMPLKTYLPPPQSLATSQYLIQSYQDREQRIEALRSLVWGPDYKKLPFPVKLHKLLSYDPISSDLWWTDGGRSFAVDRQGFKHHVMNVFFDEHKFRSFQTLLHKYGFRSVQSINNTVADIIVYRHKLFVQNNICQCKDITRTPSHRSSATSQQQSRQGQQEDAPPEKKEARVPPEKTMRIGGC